VIWAWLEVRARIIQCPTTSCVIFSLMPFSEIKCQSPWNVLGRSQMIGIYSDQSGDKPRPLIKPSGKHYTSTWKCANWGLHLFRISQTCLIRLRLKAQFDVNSNTDMRYPRTNSTSNRHHFDGGM
jgi:hypothetical protein